MTIIPNVNKENSCLDCPVWSLCWDSKPTEDICKDRCPIVEFEGVRLFDDDMPTIEAEPRWIPCSERLPEKSGRYLVTIGLNACDAVWNRVYIINYSDLMGLKSERIWWTGNVGKSDFKRIDYVTAWMPLPEPYRGVKE